MVMKDKVAAAMIGVGFVLILGAAGTSDTGGEGFMLPLIIGAAMMVVGGVVGAIEQRASKEKSRPSCANRKNGNTIHNGTAVHKNHHHCTASRSKNQERGRLKDEISQFDRRKQVYTSIINGKRFGIDNGGHVPHS